MHGDVNVNNADYCRQAAHGTHDDDVRRRARRRQGERAKNGQERRHVIDVQASASCVVKDELNWQRQQF